MTQAAWTFERPPAGSDAAGLEEYLVEDAAGDRVGKVFVVVRRHAEVFLLVEGGAPPLTHDLRAVPWAAIAEVDHASLAVRLVEGALDEATELDPASAVEDGEAEAVRVTDLPRQLAPAATAAAPGPIDAFTYVLSLATGFVGLLGLLGFIAAVSVSDASWWWALGAVPVALLAISGILVYRVWRSPYSRRPVQAIRRPPAP